MNTPADDISAIENLLQSGEFSSAHLRLKEINTNKLTRDQFANYVNLSWRSGNVDLGLELLNPLIKNKAARLSEKEWGEYAMCLNSIGAVVEAKKILSQDARSYKFFDLYSSFSFIYEWNYQEAIPHLENAIKNLPPASYQYDVGRINLLACFVAQEKYPEANELIRTLKDELNEKHKRLRSNLEELTLQLLSGESRYQEGLQFLNQKYGVTDSKGPEEILFQKWKTILEVGAGSIEKEELLKVRDLAFAAKMWEVARDCETRYAFITQNPTFLKRAFFSTPWGKYRERITHQFADKIDFHSSFDLWLYPSTMNQSQHPPPQFILDVENGIIGSMELKKGALSHRLLRVLSSDTFRPHSVGGLFSKLYSAERFDIATSPNRVYRAISELRDILTSAGAPLEIAQIDTGYRLSPLQTITLRLGSATTEGGQIELKLASLKSIFADDFSAKQAAEALKVSLKTAQRLLNAAIQDDHVERLKVGASVHYKWKNKVSAKTGS